MAFWGENLSEIGIFGGKNSENGNFWVGQLLKNGIFGGKTL